MCEVFSTSWGFLVDFKRFLFVQFVGRRATNLRQGNGKRLSEFYENFTLVFDGKSFFFPFYQKINFPTSEILE